jgi:cytochrome b subunit of formate dehydrogenase
MLETIAIILVVLIILAIGGVRLLKAIILGMLIGWAIAVVCNIVTYVGIKIKLALAK